MPANYYYPTSKNAIQKTLAAQLLSTASTGDAITFDDVEGIQNKPGVLVINRINANGVATPSSREFISFSEVSGSTVLIETRNVDSSGAARTHAVGSIVEFIADAVWGQRVIDQALVEHTVAGKHSVADMITGGSVIDDDTMATASATTLATSESTKAYVDVYGQNTSLFRQAIINGNFDVWQRGTSMTTATTGGYYAADRWYVLRAASKVAYTASRQDGTGIAGSRYCLRLQRDSGNTDTAAITLSQAFETTNSIPLVGQKLTLSFYARKGANYSATSDVLVSSIWSDGGTDEKATAYASPTVMATANNTLTTSWQKFTISSADAVATGETEIAVYFSFTPTGTAGAADYFEIAQVQLNAGSVALPFQPKSFEEELRACQRYYEKSYDYAVAPGTAIANSLGSGTQFTHSAGNGGTTVSFKVKKRTTPTVTTYDAAGTADKLTIYTSSWANGADYTYKQPTENSFYVLNLTGSVINTYFQWIASAEL